MEIIPVIHDGDHGSDDLIATLIFAAHPERFDLLGVTTGFGNTSAGHAVRNAGLALALAGRRNVPVCCGGDRPFSIAPKGGDNAFDEDGLGGVGIALDPPAPHPLDSVSWMARTLELADRPVTLCVTGTMTNAALLLRDHPHIKTKIARIIFMGGCIGPLGPQARHGNITMFAEFNVFMDPEAAAFIFDAGIAITLLPMDATHQSVFTPERQHTVLDALPPYPGHELAAMMRAAEKYDIPNFSLPGAVFHDQNVPVYLLAPHLYKTARAGVFVNTDAASERHGQLRVDPDDERDITIVEALDDRGVFDVILGSLKKLFPK